MCMTGSSWRGAALTWRLNIEHNGGRRRVRKMRCAGCHGKGGQNRYVISVSIVSLSDSSHCNRSVMAAIVSRFAATATATATAIRELHASIRDRSLLYDSFKEKEEEDEEEGCGGVG